MTAKLFSELLQEEIKQLTYYKKKLKNLTYDKIEKLMRGQ